MNNCEIKNLNLLGHKRYNNNIKIQKDESKIENREKEKENNPKKKAEFFYILKEEKNGPKIDNINIKSENIFDKKSCLKCNSINDLLFFNSLENILDYLSKNKIFIFKNNVLDKNINFDSPKIICSNCLMKISKNQNEFENFIKSNINKNNDANINPVNNILENSSVENIDYIDIKKNNNQNLNELNDNNNNTKNTEKLLPHDSKITSSVNNGKNNIGNKTNLNLDVLNTLKYPFLPLINYNMPFNQKIGNLNIPNFLGNNLNSLLDMNTNLKNQETKENGNNQNNSSQKPILNHSINNSIKQLNLFPLNNINELNSSKMPASNEECLVDKNNKNEDTKENTKSNNIETTKNGNEKILKDDNKILDKNNILKNCIKIKSKDFDEIFDITSNLYNKVLDIKISRDLNLDIKKLFKEDNRILSSKNLNLFNSN